MIWTCALVIKMVICRINPLNATGVNMQQVPMLTDNYGSERVNELQGVFHFGMKHRGSWCAQMHLPPCVTPDSPICHSHRNNQDINENHFQGAELEIDI